MLDHLKNLCGKSVQTLKDERGQGLVEYALILVLIAVVVIVAVRGIGCQANSTFSKVNSALTVPAAQ
jgi:pilus assembly protein Flp/PilA